MEKVNKIMGAFWLVIIVLSVGYVGYMFFYYGFSGNEQLLAIPGIAIFWYITRTRLKQRIEKNMNQDNQDN